MSVEDIIQKYGYNEELANFLRSAYPLYVEEFKDERIVYEAFMKTPIYLCDNVYECLKEHGHLDDREDNEMVPLETLKVSAGVYDCAAKLSYNEYSKEYTITNEDRIVAINAYSLKIDSCKSTLVHELGHLIKAYYNEHTIKGDTLVEKSGFITRIYQLSNENGRIKKTLWSETGVGLEEGLNAVLEEKIMARLLGKADFRSMGYQTMKNIALNVMNAYKIPNLWNIFKEAQIYHDNTRVDEVLGQVFYKIMAFADKLYPLNVEILNMNTTKERREEADKEMDILIKEEYTPISEELKSIGQSSMAM